MCIRNYILHICMQMYWYTRWCKCARQLVFNCEIIYNIERHCPVPSGLIILGLLSFSGSTLIKLFKPLGFLCFRCLTAVTDSVTLDTAVIAITCEWFGGYITAGFLEIVVRMRNVVVVLLPDTGALALGVLMSMPVGVRTVVPVRYILLLSVEQVGLELLVNQGDILF